MSKTLEIAPATRAADVIGSSEIAAIVGANPYQTPFDLAVVKKGLAEKKVTSQMTRGKQLEQIVATMWSEQEGIPIRWLDKTVVGPEPWAVATPDFEVSDRAGDGGEVKTVSPYMVDKWGEEGSDEIPEHYLIQTQWVALCMGWKRVRVPAFFHRDSIKTYSVVADSGLQGALLKAAREFRERYLLTDSLPPITAPSEIVDSYLRRKFSGSPLAPLREANENESQGVQMLGEIKANIKQLEEAKGALEGTLKESIGDSEGIAGAWGKLTWRPVKGRTSTDWKALAERFLIDVPNRDSLIADFTKTGEGYRRLLLTLKGGKAND